VLAEKASSPIVVLLESTIVERLPHLANAYLPIEATLEGIVTLVMLPQVKNA
jgi:hypothetical protein